MRHPCTPNGSDCCSVRLILEPFQLCNRPCRITPRQGAESRSKVVCAVFHLTVSLEHKVDGGIGIDLIHRLGNRTHHPRLHGSAHQLRERSGPGTCSRLRGNADDAIRFRSTFDLPGYAHSAEWVTPSRSLSI